MPSAAADRNDRLWPFAVILAVASRPFRCSTPPLPHVPCPDTAAHDRGEGGAAQRLIRIDDCSTESDIVLGFERPIAPIALPQEPHGRGREMICGVPRCSVEDPVDVRTALYGWQRRRVKQR